MRGWGNKIDRRSGLPRADLEAALCDDKSWCITIRDARVGPAAVLQSEAGIAPYISVLSRLGTHARQHCRQMILCSVLNGDIILFIAAVNDDLSVLTLHANPSGVCPVYNNTYI